LARCLSMTCLRLSDKNRKALYKTAIAFCTGSEVVSIEYGEMLGPLASFTSSLNVEMTRCATTLNISHFNYVDLSMSIEKIWANYRKSYKALINAGKKIWAVSMMEHENHEIWDQFRQLHIQVAGRETRSLATWDLQHRSIADKNGFLIYLQDDTGRMVGGGFFQHTRDEALYAVGAYDRELFDRPLGHVVQHTAILEMQRRNLKWYKLGQRFYAASLPCATDKKSQFRRSRRALQRINLCELIL